MKVLVVGGAGEMGRVAARLVAADEAIDSVVVADLDIARASAVATAIGPKAEAIGLDITDATALEAAVDRVDLVLNTVGPFYLFGPPVLRAAIAAGRHYADIADDWEPTVEMLGYGEHARRAGVTALVGIGASPGVSNLLASAAHASLDEVEVLHTVWKGGVGIPYVEPGTVDVHPSAAIDHWIHNLAEPIRLRADGVDVESSALEEFVVNFPGIGPTTVWSCGHPEPITLPRTFTDLRSCANLMFARPGLIEIARQIRDEVRAGSLSVPEASRKLLLSPNRSGAAAGPLPEFPGVFGYAEGWKDGRRARSVVSTPVIPRGGMGEATCGPLAVAAGMLARGEVHARGVFAPEGALDPELFFSRMSALGDGSSEQFLAVTTEPF